MASLDTKWLHAQLFLAWRLVMHFARKLWPWAPRYGFARFQENYVAEGLPPTLPDFRLLAPELGRCTACKLCDDVCPILRGTVSVDCPDGFLGPATFVLSGARSATNLEDLKGTLTPGKLADITVLSKDILSIPEEEIPTTRVELTIVGGEVVYRAGSGGLT